MREKLQALWDSIPLAGRTVINVGIAAAITVVGGAILDAHGVTAMDFVSTGSKALNAAAVAIFTVLVRGTNPLDKAYGVGKPKADPAPLDAAADIDSSDGTEVAVDPATLPTEPGA